MNKKSKSTLEKYEVRLRVQGYSERTITTYVHYVSLFLSNFTKDFYHVPQKEAAKFLENTYYSSRSVQNQYISSVKLLYRIMGGGKLIIKVSRPRKEKKLPRVIDKDFLLESISNIENKKHKAILALTYSVGLRVSEVINLKVVDIDGKRGVINIRQAKGNKDRIVPLSDGLRYILRKYYQEYNPREYLFNGQTNLKYSSTSCNKIIKKYLGGDTHMHLLRHSSATAMLEGGTDIKTIQNILGHKRSTTTDIYLHLSTQHLQKAVLPI